MKKHISTIITAVAALLLMNGPQAPAQTFFGLEAGKCYSPAEMEASTGMQAEDIAFTGSARDWKHGYEATFKGGLLVCAFTDGEFYAFEVTGRKYRLFEDALEGGIGVGDDVSRVFSLRGGYPKALDYGPGNESAYRIFTKQEDSYTVQYDKRSGRITAIRWVIAR